MEKKKNIVTQVEDTLNSLDGLEKASPGPFFFTRMQARLQKGKTSQWAIIISFITKPAVAIASLSLIILLNAAALFYQQEHSSAIALADQNEQAYTTDDYNTTMATNSYYDENSESR